MHTNIHTFMHTYTIKREASEMAQRVKVLAAKPNIMKSILGCHTVREENILL